MIPIEVLSVAADADGGPDSGQVTTWKGASLAHPDGMASARKTNKAAILDMGFVLSNVWTNGANPVPKIGLCKGGCAATANS